MRKRRIGCAVGLVLLVSIVQPGAALAHAAYKSSDPANGSTVSSPPSRVTAEFTERLTQGSRLTVYDPCGAQVDHGDSLVAGTHITISMSADKRGLYTVHFDVVSAVDSHPTNGKFSFTSSGGGQCAGAAGEQKTGSSEQPKDAGGASQTNANNDDASSSGSGSSASSGDPTSSGGGSDGNTRRRIVSKDRSDGGRMPRHRQGARVPNIQGVAASAEGQEPSVLDGIPARAFAIALLLAALIGAAGGKIYAGIMGWTRPRGRS